MLRCKWSPNLVVSFLFACLLFRSTYECRGTSGEYTTGFVGGGASGSDKKVGVVGLSLFDLRRRGKVGDLSMVGVSGKKFPGIRKLSERAMYASGSVWSSAGNEVNEVSRLL
jgi:hypothetical protein